MADRKVTEQDFRRPEFINANPDDYEFRDDGAIVRKDRWENAVRSIRNRLGDYRREFEVSDVVEAVKALVASIERPDEEESGR